MKSVPETRMNHGAMLVRRGAAGPLRSKTLLNAALWAALLIGAWLLYPNQAGHTETSHAHTFIAFKIVA